MFNPANSPDLRRGIKFMEAKAESPHYPPRAQPKGPLDTAWHKERISAKLQNPEFYDFVLHLNDGGVIQDLSSFPQRPRIVLDYFKEWIGEQGQSQYDETLPHPHPTTICAPIKLVDHNGSRAGILICPIPRYRADWGAG